MRKAVEVLNEVRKNRGLSASPLAESLSSDEVWEELIKEWRKEFVGDGQLFFFYKRIGSSRYRIPQWKVMMNYTYCLCRKKRLISEDEQI